MQGLERPGGRLMGPAALTGFDGFWGRFRGFAAHLVAAKGRAVCSSS